MLKLDCVIQQYGKIRSFVLTVMRKLQPRGSSVVTYRGTSNERDTLGVRQLRSLQVEQELLPTVDLRPVVIEKFAGDRFVECEKKMHAPRDRC